MTALHRDRYHVVGLPVLRTDIKPLASTIAAACDEIHDVPLHDARNIVSSLQLDVVFADTLSGRYPLSGLQSSGPFPSGILGKSGDFGQPVHRLLRQRYGNGLPIPNHFPEVEGGLDHSNHNGDAYGTGGFVGRTRNLVSTTQGSSQRATGEQLERVCTQPGDAEAMSGVYNRSSFGLEKQWFVYLCPQSTFKMHPLFDRVMADVLMAAPHA